MIFDSEFDVMEILTFDQAGALTDEDPEKIRFTYAVSFDKDDNCDENHISLPALLTLIVKAPRQSRSDFEKSFTEDGTVASKELMDAAYKLWANSNFMEKALIKCALQGVYKGDKILSQMQYGSAIREYITTYLHNVSGGDLVLECPWYVPTENAKNPVRKDRIRFALFGGMAGSALNELGSDVATNNAISTFSEAYDKLNKQAHLKAETVSLIKGYTEKHALQTFEAMLQFQEGIAEARRESGRRLYDRSKSEVLDTIRAMVWDWSKEKFGPNGRMDNIDNAVMHINSYHNKVQLVVRGKCRFVGNDDPYMANHLNLNSLFVLDFNLGLDAFVVKFARIGAMGTRAFFVNFADGELSEFPKMML